ncbi:ATP-binding protein [candidate division KSB1 bacterium]
MFSYFKLKIIFWYTFLLSVILASALIATYKFQGYHLKKEINTNLIDKVNYVERATVDRLSSRRRGQSYRDIPNSGRGRDFTFYDLQQYTEIADDNYVMFIFIDDDLEYLTDKYENPDLQVSPFNILDKQVADITFDDIPFSMSVIHKTGFSVYIGYELSALTDLQKKLIQIFFYVFPIGVLLSVLCGFLVTQRSLNVIKKIDDTANNITSFNLSQRINAPKGKDEISDLIGTLNSMISRLEISFSQAQQFSQDAAHEIRTPLTIIRGEIEEMLGEETCPEDVSQTLENILEEIQYLSSIANRLLLIHSMDTGKVRYHFENIDLNELLDDTFQDAKILSAEKKIGIELNADQQIEVNGNKELLTRLLWNIIDNAVKYNKPDGNIVIDLSMDDNNAMIKVTDSGIGIPPEEIPKIFDRFYRVDKSRSREIGGSGLGLAICKWIIDLHKGEIQVNSEVDKGSEFTIIIPVD